MPWGPFNEQTVYNRRRDVHAVYGGQEQGGICTPSRFPVIFAFTGAGGEQHGYTDGWKAAEGVFRYFGEGQVGDMVFERGNRAIRDHLVDGKDLLLFQTVSGGIRFLGQFDCASFSMEMAPDREGNTRSAIVFEFVPVGVLDQDPAPGASQEELVSLSPLELRKRALEAAQPTPNKTGVEARRSLYRRSQVVRRYVLARSGGRCESCGEPAPFQTRSGEFYLEPHHTRRLSDGGPDDPRFVGAICPNCHREMHYGQEGEAKNSLLVTSIQSKEAALDEGLTT